MCVTFCFFNKKSIWFEILLEIPLKENSKRTLLPSTASRGEVLGRSLGVRERTVQA